MENYEAKLLSAVLQDKQIHVVMQANADHLFRTHRDVWDFVKGYYEKNATMPPTHLVMEKFSDFIPVQDVGATKFHLEELREHWTTESLKAILRQSATELQSGDTKEALSVIVSKTGELMRTSSAARDLDAVDVEDAVRHFTLMKELNELGSVGIKTGLAGFDDYMPAGITPGQFGVILAYPAIGKSWLALFLAVQAWRNGKTPLVISLEMTEAEVRNRIYTILGAGLFSHRKLSAGLVDIEEFKKWGEQELVGKPPIHIISNDGIGDMTPAVVRGYINQYSPDITFVDYMQLMQANNGTDNETVKIKNISRELKVLAISEHTAIVAIASATPDDVNDMQSAPTLGQVAWSKQIAYDADFLLALGRAVNSDVIECVFRKNRNGFLGEFMLMVDFDRGLFKYRDYDEL